MTPPTPAAFLAEPFDPDLGLWTQDSPGHTSPVAELPQVHSGPNASSRLMVYAQRRELDTFPTTRVIQALSDLQVRDGSPRHGACRWYAEEPEPIDTNASFFIALNLIVLSRAFPEDLNETQHAILREMHEAFRIWFQFEADEGKVHYPNKYLGDLTCLWLLHEELDLDTSPLLEVMERSALYWQETHWGWGEHLSDIYSSILLDELSCLLLFADTLPERLRNLYTALFHDLLAIEDAFAGGPRVPTIRSYAFGYQCTHDSYRSKIAPFEPGELPLHNPRQVTHLYRFPLGQVLADRGWHELAGPVSKLRSSIRIPCVNGHTAHAVLKGPFRLGALSQYPVMANTDHPTWGLSWQTMPVAFSSSEGEWGFLRWGSQEHGAERYHPAKDKHSAFLHNALTDTVSPPIAGQTRSRTRGSSFLIERRMPRVSRDWTWCSDLFCLSGFRGSASTEHCGDGWHRLTLTWASNLRLTVYMHALESSAQPELTSTGEPLVWGITWGKEDLQTLNQLCCLWGFHLGENTPPPPVLRKEAGWFRTPHFMPGDAQWQAEWQGIHLRPGTEA